MYGTVSLATAYFLLGLHSEIVLIETVMTACFSKTPYHTVHVYCSCLGTGRIGKQLYNVSKKPGYENEYLICKVCAIFVV